MKILFTADIHLNIPARHPRTELYAYDVFKGIIDQENPDVVVVAGDIGSPKRAADHLAEIRSLAGDRLLAITLGNHDFWLDSLGHAQYTSIDQAVTRYWQEPARDIGAVLLDRENADLGDFMIVGGYGHFDLGLAEPDLHIRGVRITKEIYLTGGLFWNDFRFIPNCGTRVHVEAQEQATGIAARMDDVISKGKRLLLAIHTCPWRSLNGHPVTGASSDILSAYSGNSLLGAEIEKRAAAVDFLMCGHTHKVVREHKIHGIPCLNVGADYGIFRGVIFDTVTQQIQWIGEPVI